MPRKTLKTLCPLNLSSLSKEDAQRRQNNATQQEHLYQCIFLYKWTLSIASI